MDTILEFAKGPLFRFSLAIMVLGLARVLFLALYGIVKSYFQAGDKDVPTGTILRRTLGWIIPHQHALRSRPIFSVISILFHIGLLAAPLFLYAHIELLRKDLGFGWPALPKLLADIFTILTAVTAILLIGFRALDSTVRALSRAGDYFWLVLLAIPFISGFLCIHTTLNPISYKAMLLIHILSGELIFVLIPFTKISHCVLFPFTQMISDLGWRFPAGSGKKVEATLGNKGVSQ